MHETLHHLPHRPLVKLMTFMLILTFTLQVPLYYAVAGDTGEPLTKISDENYLYYHHSDHLGSSNLLTEGKDSSLHSGVTYKKGDLLQRFEYEPFGKEKYILNPNLKFDPSYTGQIYDVETGLYYYKARYYNPELGRFIQADTVVPDAKNLQAYNRYSYVMNNPFKYTDPSGHSFMSWFKKLAGAFFGALVGVITGFIVAPGLVALLGSSFWGGVVAGIIGGAVGGALGGAISGGHMGALYGLAFGAVGGGLAGAANHFLGVALKITNVWVRVAILGSVGAMISGTTGGWRGLVTFGAGFLGALAGMGVTEILNEHAKIKASTPETDSRSSGSAIDEVNTDEWSQKQFAQLARKVGPAPEQICRNMCAGGGIGRSGLSGGMDTIPAGNRISVQRLTGPGEQFVRYESANPNYTRITPSGGVKPGTYAAPASDGIVPLQNRVPVYNLPDAHDQFSVEITFVKIIGATYPDKFKM